MVALMAIAIATAATDVNAQNRADANNARRNHSEAKASVKHKHNADNDRRTVARGNNAEHRHADKHDAVRSDGKPQSFDWRKAYRAPQVCPKPMAHTSAPRHSFADRKHGKHIKHECRRHVCPDCARMHNAPRPAAGMVIHHRPCTYKPVVVRGERLIEAFGGALLRPIVIGGKNCYVVIG